MHGKENVAAVYNADRAGTPTSDHFPGAVDSYKVVYRTGEGGSTVN